MAMSLDDTVLAQCILRELTHLKVNGYALRESACSSSSDTETPSPASSQSLSSSVRSASPLAPTRLNMSTISAPPGLSSPSPPPGLSPPGLPLPLPLASLLPPPSPQRASRESSAGELPEELRWSVVNPNAKFKSSCGCPLVSQPLQVGDLEDVRVIFAPGKLWMTEYCRTTKKHKKTQACEELPKFGSLQLKISGSAQARPQKFFLLLGSKRMGPITSPAGQCTTEVLELPMDWRRELQGGGLQIAVEMERA